MGYLKNIITVLTLCVMTVFSVCLFPAGAAPAQEIEEPPDMVMSSDTVITGKMDDYSKKSIEVDYIRYNLCKNLKVFNHRNRLINYKDIDAALEVKLFRNDNCVRKIKVLRFAQ